jgi:serine/threonine protein kinase
MPALLKGRYLLERYLSQGWKRDLLLAQDTRTNRLCCVIELISDLDELQKDLHDFDREAGMLASLDHPLIPKFIERFQEDSCHYMVREYVSGENLEERLERW